MKNILLLFAMLISSFGYGQRICGTPSTVSTENVAFPKIFTSHTLKVYYHIIAKNNGNQPTTDFSTIVAAHNALNARFLSSNICFVLSGHDVVQSNYLRNWNVTNNSHIQPLIDDLFSQNVQSDAINVYIIDADEETEIKKFKKYKLDENFMTPIGAAESIPGHSLFMTQENFDTEVFSHEMGHVLGLYHTFEEVANGIDDGNCSACGDLVYDTPPQPGTCIPLDANCELPCFLPYNTDALESNYMNYAVSFSCLSAFTDGQRNRMHGIIDATPDLVQRLVQFNRTITNLAIPLTIGFATISEVVLEAKGTLTVQDVKIFPTGKGAFRAEEEVLLEPGFELLEGSRGLVIIENICKEYETQAKTVEDIVDYYENEGTRIDTKSAKLEVSETLVSFEQVNGDLLTIYPNPTYSEFQIIYKTETNYEDDSNVSIEVFDLQGHQVILLRSNFLNISRGELVKVTNLDRGLYIVVLRIGSEMVVSRLIKQ